MLREYIIANPDKVSIKESPAYPELRVLKYKKNVFFKNLWDEYLEECRGTVVDADYNIVSRPFTKIYNFGIESRAPVLADSTVVTVYRKVNGFMAAATWYNNQILISTTGSLDSQYVEMTKEMMLMHMPWSKWEDEVKFTEGTTLLFEVVHPADPHIIPEKPGVYFLGYRKNTWDSQIRGYSEVAGQQWHDFARYTLHCHPVEFGTMTIGELKKLAKSAKHEGYVAYTEDNISFKIKSPYYLALKAAARKSDILTLDKSRVDEEFFGLIDYIKENNVTFNIMNE